MSELIVFPFLFERHIITFFGALERRLMISDLSVKKLVFSGSINSKNSEVPTHVDEMLAVLFVLFLLLLLARFKSPRSKL